MFDPSDSEPVPAPAEGRRAFLRHVTLGATAGALIPDSPARAQDEPKPAVSPDQEPEMSEAEARFRLVLARFGDHLDDEARDDIRRQVEGVVRQGNALRQFALENGDEPFPVFHPYRAPLS